MKKSVELLIINEKGEILLGKRKNCAGEGSWSLFGGHIELGEEAKSAAIREAKEELGIIISELKLIKIFQDGPHTSTRYLRHFFFIESYQGNISNKEKEKCSEIAWFNLKNMPTVVFYGHMAHFLLLQELKIGDSIINELRSKNLTSSN